MATTWHPRARYGNRRSWLLTNGEVVYEPDLEQSPSGIKVRIAGTNLTAYTKDVDSLILKAVKLMAARRKAEVWMPLLNQDAQFQSILGFDTGNTKAKLHVLNKSEPTAKTIVWWRFKHPTLPLEAVLTIEATKVAYGTDQTVKARVTMPQTSLSESMYASVFDNDSADFPVQSAPLNWDDTQKFREWVRDHPAPWAQMLGSTRFTNERAMIEHLLTLVRDADALAEIEVPDLRDQDDPKWLALELQDTNFNGQLVQDLVDYLDGTPSIEEALRLYEELRTTLRAVGVVMEDRAENDFQRAMLDGDQSGVTVKLNKPNEEELTVDHDHTLTMHLPTGTFIVNCSLRTNTSHEQIADRWAEEKAIASLTGEEPALLAFAREYARTGSEERAKKILKERQKAQKVTA